MSEQDFKEGDVVVLKSGGPDMTYVGDDELDQAMCIWFEKTTRKDGSFPKSALKLKGPTTYTTTLMRG